MNKKLLIGLSAIGIAVGFWACGEGAIEPPGETTDNYVKAMLPSIDFEVQVNDAKTKCALDPVCESEMAKAQGSAIILSSSEEIVSSETAPSSSSIIASSSSYTQFSFAGPIGQQSSSSSAIVSSQSTEPSSSSVIIATGLGSCAPGATKIELNKSVEWKFTKGAGMKDAMTLMKAEFKWEFDDGMPATVDLTGKVSSGAITYSKSGKKAAKVTVISAEGTEVIQCSPMLQVNGVPITGCKCNPTNIEPDVSKGESATWTLSGCTSTGANIISYTWTGATADASGLIATAPVAAKGDVVTGVSVTVANDDNTVETYTCDDAKAIDETKPDYLFEIKGDQITSTAMAVKNEGCMSIRGTWSNTGYSPNIQVLCDGKADDQNAGMTFSMTYGGKTIAQAPANSTWGFSNVGGAIGQIKVGDVSFNNICVKFTGASTVSCKIQ